MTNIQNQSETGSASETFTMNDPDILQFMSDKVQFLWEHYIGMIHQTMLITGGTVLILMNGLFIVNSSKEWHLIWLAFTALSSAGIAMVFSFSWRFTSQYFMSREILGNRTVMERYYQLCRIRTSSNYEVRYYDEKSYRTWRAVFSLSRVSAIGLLFLSWVLGGLFIYVNFS